MKKWLTGLAALGLTLGLAGCGNDAASDPSPGQGGSGDGVRDITAWAWDPNFNIRALNIARDAFSQINPDIQVEIVENAQDSIIQQMNVMLSSGTTTGLPNIVLIEDYRAQVFLQAFPGMFYSLDDYINPGDFAEYKIPMTSFEGRQYGVPFDTGVTGLFVRTDILEDAGFTLDDVTNIDWDELIEIAIQVRDATGVPMLTVDPGDLAIIRTAIQTAGSWYTLEDGVTPHIADNEELKIAFEFFARLITEGISTPVTDWGQFVGAFNNGDVWSVPTGNWITASVMSAQDQSGNWAIVPQPRLPRSPQAVNASNLGGSSWYVLNIDGKEAAAEFLAATFGSNAEFYVELLNEIGAMGTFIPATRLAEFEQEVEFFARQRIFQDFAEWTQMIPDVNFGIHTYAIEDILAVAMQSYLNGQDLATVLQEAQSQADSQLN